MVDEKHLIKNLGKHNLVKAAVSNLMEKSADLEKTLKDITHRSYFYSSRKTQKQARAEAMSSDLRRFVK